MARAELALLDPHDKITHMDFLRERLKRVVEFVMPPEGSGDEGPIASSDAQFEGAVASRGRPHVRPAIVRLRLERPEP